MSTRSPTTIRRLGASSGMGSSIQFSPLTGGGGRWRLGEVGGGLSRLRRRRGQPPPPSPVLPPPPPTPPPPPFVIWVTCPPSHGWAPHPLRPPPPEPLAPPL